MRQRTYRQTKDNNTNKNDNNKVFAILDKEYNDVDDIISLEETNDNVSITSIETQDNNSNISNITSIETQDDNSNFSTASTETQNNDKPKQVKQKKE